ncbi:MAG: Ig-like domain-containing protein [Gemmatimonadetes bacterium]|nr:Ig-like domain-containing protein [Gemmatimonadota bacterium]
MKVGIRHRTKAEIAARAWLAACGLLALNILGCGGETAVSAREIATVDIEPGEMLLVGVGDGASFTATARDADGFFVAGTARWSIDRPAVATITDAGFASAMAAGTATVTATVGGVSGTAQLEVYVPARISRYTVGQSYYGRRDYVEYIPGTLPVILSSSHGGAMTPTEIPNRTFGVVRNDTNSLELTVAMRQALIDLTGQAPHVIYSHLHRSKLDANREIVEAAQDNPYAELAWEEFHEWIKVARATVAADYGKGMYFDIHGHGHDIERLELGYLLTSEELNRPDASLNSLAVVAETSIRDLGRTSPIPFSHLLRGPTSLGGLFAEEDIPSVPSPADPGPGDAPYFRGGYNTREYGSFRDAEVVSGIQIEHHYRGVRDTPDNRFIYATKAARVIRDFMLEHYGFFETGGTAPAR